MYIISDSFSDRGLLRHFEELWGIWLPALLFKNIFSFFLKESCFSKKNPNSSLEIAIFYT